tara:strand:- start:1880 stop:2764 length:885 start_codon:yes stop_codon:yes gene_type:complete
MHSKKVKHSKIRNTGLLFEFLLRQVTVDVLGNLKESKALTILTKYFKENTELGRELSLYNSLLNNKFNSDKKAEYFINEVLNHRSKSVSHKIKKERYNLIKSLKENYDVDKLLSSKVDNYTVYASIYKLFEYSDKLSAEEKTESHFNLVEHITTKSSVRLKDSIHPDLLKSEDLRIITYKTLLEKFNSKYATLNSPQKYLLKEYINNISNTNSLKDTLKEIVNGLKKDLKTHSKNLKDKVVKIKMSESIKSIDKFCGIDSKNTVVKDSHVIQTLRYMELLKELKKSASKNKKTL